MRRRQPKMQRKHGHLGQQPNRHQRAGQACWRIGARIARKQADIKRAIGAIEQSAAKQIKNRTKQREKQVAKLCLELRRPPIKAGKRQRGEGQHLQRHKKAEQIARQKGNGEGGR